MHFTSCLTINNCNIENKMRYACGLLLWQAIELEWRLNFIINDWIIHAKYMQIVHRDFEAHNQEKFTYYFLIKFRAISAKPWPKYRIWTIKTHGFKHFQTFSGNFIALQNEGHLFLQRNFLIAPRCKKIYLGYFCKKLKQ